MDAGYGGPRPSISRYVWNSTHASTLEALRVGVFYSFRGLAVPDQELLSLAMELRARAEEMLARAETFHDADVRQKMRGIAAGSENLAQRLEQYASNKER
jgi:hypothetical protein